MQRQTQVMAPAPQTFELVRKYDELDEALTIEAEMQALEQELSQVNALFKDMYTLIQDQRPMIDNIAYNVEQSVAATDEGVLELQKAKNNQTTGCIIC